MERRDTARVRYAPQIRRSPLNLVSMEAAAGFTGPRSIEKDAQGRFEGVRADDTRASGATAKRGSGLSLSVSAARPRFMPSEIVIRHHREPGSNKTPCVYAAPAVRFPGDTSASVRNILAVVNE